MTLKTLLTHAVVSKLFPLCQLFLEVQLGAPDGVLIWFWLDCYTCWLQCNQYVCKWSKEEPSKPSWLDMTKSASTHLTHFDSRKHNYSLRSKPWLRAPWKSISRHQKYYWYWCFPSSIVTNASLARHMSNWRPACMLFPVWITVASLHLHWSQLAETASYSLISWH